jgi:hypothetical protein
VDRNRIPPAEQTSVSVTTEISSVASDIKKDNFTIVHQFCAFVRGRNAACAYP